MSDALDVRIEWLEAPGVTTPELAKTWARYEIWVGNRCVTQVEASPGTSGAPFMAHFIRWPSGLLETGGFSTITSGRRPLSHVTGHGATAISIRG